MMRSTWFLRKRVVLQLNFNSSVTLVSGQDRFQKLLQDSFPIMDKYIVCALTSRSRCALKNTCTRKHTMATVKGKLKVNIFVALRTRM